MPEEIPDCYSARGGVGRHDHSKELLVWNNEEGCSDVHRLKICHQSFLAAHRIRCVSRRDLNL